MVMGDVDVAKRGKLDAGKDQLPGGAVRAVNQQRLAIDD
jgi:hypothetical protein